MNLKSRLKNLFYKEESSDVTPIHDNSSQATITQIELEDKTPIASSSRLKLEDNNSVESIDVYFPKKGKTVSFDKEDSLIIPQLTGLSEISSDNLSEATTSVIREIDQFNKQHSNQTFPNLAIQIGLYKLIRERINLLKHTDPFAFSELLDVNYLKDKINNFINLEDQA